MPLFFAWEIDHKATLEGRTLIFYVYSYKNQKVSGNELY